MTNFFLYKATLKSLEHVLILYIWYMCVCVHIQYEENK